MGYVDWYEYMKNPYEKQSNIICHKNNDSFTWSDLITGNNFILSNKTKNNIINVASNYVVEMIKNKNYDEIFLYLKGECNELKNKNYDLWLFPQLPYYIEDNNIGLPRLMDYFSLRTGILFALNDNIDKTELKKVSYFSAIKEYLNTDSKNYINKILNSINIDSKIEKKLNDIDSVFNNKSIDDLEEYKIDVVKGGVVKVKEYLLETSKIKEIRGASMILDKINREAIPKEIEKYFISESVVYAGGGNILLVLPKGKGNEFSRHIEEIYEETTVIAQNVAISTEISLKDLAGDLYHTTMTNIEYLLKERQMSKVDFRTEGYKGSLKYIKEQETKKQVLGNDNSKLCSSCNTRIAKYKLGDKEYCLSCLHKNIIGGQSAKKSFQDEFEKYCNSNNLNIKSTEVLSLKDVKSDNETNSIGIIYGDGNNMGAVINKVKNILQMKYFSDKTENSVKEAVYGALANNLKYNENVLGKFEIIALGGDDIFIIVPGDKAINISKDIGNRFDNVFFNYTNADNDNLTMSLGVTISKYDKPVQYLFDMSIQLLKSAKSKAKKVKKGTIDFIVLETDAAFASNIKFLRSKLNTKSKICTLKPYTFKELENLINVITRLKLGDGKNSFRSKAYRFMEATLKMKVDEGNLFYAYQRVKNNDKKILDEVYKYLKDDYDIFEGKMLYLNNKKTNKKCSIWLDVVELWDYVNGGELHE